MRTIGVEEELLVVDAEGGAPRSVAQRLLRTAQQPVERLRSSQPEEVRQGPGGHVSGELQQQQLEIDTPPRVSAEDLERDLREWRGVADAGAREVGARVLASGTSPVPVLPRLTHDERYERMREQFGLTAREQLTCGCHVHIEVGSDEEGVAVLDGIRRWLPALLALSANSPYWQGQDSGYASFRSQVWARWPSAGPADPFGSVAGYRQRVEAMIATGVVLDEGMVYFDARLSAGYPTVEVRVADVCLDVRDTVLVAVLSRALVETAARQHERGERPDPVPTQLLRLATWQASRFGAGGDLLDPVTSRPRPAAEVLAALLDHVRPALRETGDEERVEERVAGILRHGSGAVRQRAAAKARGGRLEGAVADLVQVTAG